jgi:hypothetical protein
LKLAEVVSIYDKNASDIPAMLREAADKIESGEVPTRAIIGVAIDPDGDLTIYGWGQTDSMDALALLQLAVVKHAAGILGDG